MNWLHVKNNIIKVHGLLRSKSDPNNKSSNVVLFNRDTNGSLNIRKKALYSIKNKKLPTYLVRNTKNQQDFIGDTCITAFNNAPKTTCGSANLKAPLQLSFI